MNEKDWEARFKVGRGELPSDFKFFSGGALVVALTYCLVSAALMIWTLGTQDAESITATWPVLGFSAIFFVHALNGWAAVPVNGLIIYAFAALVTAYWKRRVLSLKR